LVQALLALFLFDFMIPQGMTISLVAGAESIQPPNDMAAMMRTVLNWLECEECINGELKAVIRLHNIAVPPLSIALREGPSPASLEIYRRELMVSYMRMANYHGSTAHSQLTLTRDEYIALHLGNYVSLYQVRALAALSMIGGTTATAALEDALHVPLPREIEIRVREALARREWQNRRIQ
jgi:hypothetical protein